MWRYFKVQWEKVVRRHGLPLAANLCGTCEGAGEFKILINKYNLWAELGNMLN